MEYIIERIPYGTGIMVDENGFSPRDCFTYFIKDNFWFVEQKN